MIFLLFFFFFRVFFFNYMFGYIVYDFPGFGTKGSEKCEILDSRLQKCITDQDALEQYSRRNCLRISRMPEKHGENIDKLVLDICKQNQC